MTKRDVLIFLSDVSNAEIVEYLVMHLEPDQVITEPMVQRFKEWLAGKLADPEVEDDEDEAILINDNDVSTIYQPDE